VIILKILFAMPNFHLFKYLPLHPLRKIAGYLFVLPGLLYLLPEMPANVSHDSQEGIVYYTQSGRAEFTSRVPLHTFTGKSDNLVGMIDLENNVIDFYIDLRSVETGIDRRDRDMHRTLSLDVHPFAEFTGALESPVELASGNEKTVTAVGEFTVHGVTREVRIDGTIKLQDDKLQLEAEWELNIEEYDIEPPGFLFLQVNEIQEMRIEATLEPRPREEILGNNDS
jgi:polyisoprenoid-binding protein YceI